jgi:hypothetical protein
MDDKILCNKLAFDPFDDFKIIQSLSLGPFDKYFFQFTGLELKVMCIEKVPTKMIQSQLMKPIPLGTTDKIVLAMIKVIVVEFKHD